MRLSLNWSCPLQITTIWLLIITHSSIQWKKATHRPPDLSFFTCFSILKTLEKQGCDMSTWVWVRYPAPYSSSLYLSVAMLHHSNDRQWHWAGLSKTGLTISSIFFFLPLSAPRIGFPKQLYNYVHCLKEASWFTSVTTASVSVHIIFVPSASNGAKLFWAMTNLFKYTRGWRETKDSLFPWRF